jgi:hypothetical protein
VVLCRTVSRTLPFCNDSFVITKHHHSSPSFPAGKVALCHAVARTLPFGVTDPMFTFLPLNYHENNGLSTPPIKKIDQYPAAGSVSNRMRNIVLN